MAIVNGRDPLRRNGKDLVWTSGLPAKGMEIQYEIERDYKDIMCHSAWYDGD